MYVCNCNLQNLKNNNCSYKYCVYNYSVIIFMLRTLELLIETIVLYLVTCVQSTLYFLLLLKCKWGLNPIQSMNHDDDES